MAGGEVIYEVNLDVDQAIAGDYRAWLGTHVREILALPGFVSAQVFDVAEPVAPGRSAWCVHYRLRDADALADYLRDHAPRMREEGLRRFGGQFHASRRVLHAAD